MTCRGDILNFINGLLAGRRDNLFTMQEVVDGMLAAGSAYKASTIRTHITSRMCANAPDNHAVTYDDLERVSRGAYRLR